MELDRIAKQKEPLLRGIVENLPHFIFGRLQIVLPFLAGGLSFRSEGSVIEREPGRIAFLESGIVALKPCRELFVEVRRGKVSPSRLWPVPRRGGAGLVRSVPGSFVRDALQFPVGDHHPPAETDRPYPAFVD